MPQNSFEELQRLAEESGVEKSLDFLEHHFRRDKAFFKLFEVLKMRCRQRMGLPLIYSQQPDDLSEPQQRELEDGLLSACREVGTLFMKSGQIQEGWMYLQPVGDKRLNEKLIRSIEVNEDNIDSVIEVAVSQGAAPAYGYELLLNHYGTCNGITTFDTQAAGFDVNVQREMASRLVRHLYAELKENVGYAIMQSTKNQDTSGDGELESGESKSGESKSGESKSGESKSGESKSGESNDRISKPDGSENKSLLELMDAYPALTENGAHHIDTTHLASAMRIARLLDDPNEISIAKQLCVYGSKLDKDFQYPGAPPFEETYRDHGFYFSALLGEQVDEAVAHFEMKSKTIKVEEYGPVADETLVELLTRVGRNDEALKVATEHLMGNEESMGIAPSAFEIAQTPDQFKQLMDVYQSKEDLLGFAVALLKSKTTQSSK